MTDFIVFVALNLLVLLLILLHRKKAINGLFEEYKDFRVLALAISEDYNELANHLCNVLEQLYKGYSEEDNNIFRTNYSYDAMAVQFLSDIGYVELIEGEWPKTKYITFKFTSLRKEML